MGMILVTASVAVFVWAVVGLIADVGALAEPGEVLGWAMGSDPVCIGATRVCCEHQFRRSVS